MTSAVSYLRVSGESQIDRGGFPRQVEDVNLFCEHSDFEILHEYREEAVPGKLGEEHRPAFQRMVADLLSNGCRTVVVSSLDRFARQYDIQQQLATYLASKEIALYSANTGENITAALMGDPMRRAMVQMQGIFFELDKNLIISKLARGRMYARIQDGIAKGYSEEEASKYGRCEGRKGYGTDPNRPEECGVLAQMLALRAEGKTPEQIAQTFNAAKIPTRYGKLWIGPTVNRILARNHS